MVAYLAKEVLHMFVIGFCYWLDKKLYKFVKNWERMFQTLSRSVWESYLFGDVDRVEVVYLGANPIYGIPLNWLYMYGKNLYDHLLLFTYQKTMLVIMFL